MWIFCEECRSTPRSFGNQLLTLEWQGSPIIKFHLETSAFQAFPNFQPSAPSLEQAFIPFESYQAICLTSF